ncbi:MAG: flagellar basal body L-ring protein FlgH [Candidatus Sericytochromatia bacterium]|nr:flagellar basal body L-ring protein FlgH [Candidatus Tanganyikabacteria bacterium]
MSRRLLALALMVLVSFAPALAARADSLFPDSNYGGLISDQVGDRRMAIGPGSLVTVVVTENIQAEQAATTRTIKDSKVTSSWDFGTIFGAGANNRGGAFNNQVEMVGKSDFNGDGVTRRGGAISMLVAAQITEILPDGSMRIKGSKELVVNDEKSTVVISGVVRPWDIGIDNRIPSQRIAGFQLEYQGSGPNTAKTTPGLFTRLLNWLF